MRLPRSSIVFFAPHLFSLIKVHSKRNFSINKQLTLQKTTLDKMYVLNFSKLFVVVACIAFLGKGVVADAQINDALVEPNLSLADGIGEIKASQCIMTSKPGKDCAVGVMQNAGASCSFNKRCSIKCNGMVGCTTNCRCIAA